MPRPRSLVAAALIVCAGSVALDRMTPATPRPAVVHVASAREVDVMHAAAAGAPAPRPVAGKASKHHPLRHLLAPLRVVRHVHRVWRIVRHPFRFWLW